MQAKIFKIFLNIVPVWIMIGLIPFVKNDHLLAVIYTAIIVVSLLVKGEPKDLLFLVFGFLMMMLHEYFFVSTGVETFVRNSLLGVMPLWLPFLWGYGFVVMKRAITILSI